MLDELASVWDDLPIEDRALAEHIVDASAPIGAAKGHRFLQASGFQVSQATVSRSLARLDEVGFTERVGREGRRIRDDARQFLARHRMHQRRNALAEHLFTDADRSRLIDLLTLRRSIEVEAVTLAVARAGKTDLDGIDTSVEAYEQHVREEGNFSADAIRFHLLLCQATHSAPYVLIGEALFPEMDRLEPMLVRASEKASAVGRSNREHSDIARALRARDADTCRILIHDHFATMIGWLRGLDDDEMSEFTKQIRG